MTPLIASLQPEWKGTFGTYAITSDSTLQLGCLAPSAAQRVYSVTGDDVARASTRVWYSWSYDRFALPWSDGPTFSRLLLFYTDATERYLRWVCANYARSVEDNRDRGKEFIHAMVENQALGRVPWHP